MWFLCQHVAKPARVYSPPHGAVHIESEAKLIADNMSHTVRAGQYLDIMGWISALLQDELRKV